MVWTRNPETGKGEQIVCDVRAETADKVLDAFLQTPCFDGKTFWEAESEMVWIE